MSEPGTSPEKNDQGPHDAGACVPNPSIPPKRRAVGYVSVWTGSSATNGEVDLQEQKQAIERHCKAEGLELAGIETDVIAEEGWSERTEPVRRLFRYGRLALDDPASVAEPISGFLHLDPIIGIPRRDGRSEPLIGPFASPCREDQVLRETWPSLRKAILTLVSDQAQVLVVRREGDLILGDNLASAQLATGMRNKGYEVHDVEHAERWREEQEKEMNRRDEGLRRIAELCGPNSELAVEINILDGRTIRLDVRARLEHPIGGKRLDELREWGSSLREYEEMVKRPSDVRRLAEKGNKIAVEVRRLWELEGATAKDGSVLRLKDGYDPLPLLRAFDDKQATGPDVRSRILVNPELAELVTEKNVFSAHSGIHVNQLNVLVDNSTKTQTNTNFLQIIENMINVHVAPSRPEPADVRQSAATAQDSANPDAEQRATDEKDAAEALTPGKKPHKKGYWAHFRRDFVNWLGGENKKYGYDPTKRRPWNYSHRFLPYLRTLHKRLKDDELPPQTTYLSWFKKTVKAVEQGKV